jgi:hypothetical protein
MLARPRRSRAAAVVAIVAVLLSAGGASAAAGSTVIAVTWSGPKAWVRLLDAATLAPRGTALPLARTSVGAHAFSPDGRRLALQTRKDGVRILSVPGMRVLRTVRPGILTAALYWQSARRLLILEHGGALLVDPFSGRIVNRRTLEPEILETRPWHGGAVILAAQSHGIGPAQLVVVDSRLQVRTVELGRIAAGVDGGENNQGPFRIATPGLALDSTGGRAFVAGGSAVAAVDLASLAVRYHGAERTLQKVSEGPRRVAAWLGDGILAISGADYAVDGQTQRMTPYGLRLLDVETGGVSIAEPRATHVVAGNGLALASGVVWTERSTSGMGVSAYDRAGDLAWHRFENASIESPQVIGSRGYVAVGRSTWHVIDLASGRTTAVRSGASLNVLG